AACADSRSATAPATPAESSLEANRAGGAVAGAVYTSTNSTTGNAVIAYSRGANGQLTRVGAFNTGGQGFGTGTDPLGSQFSLILSEAPAPLSVVNAGPHDITMFDVRRGGGLPGPQRIDSRGSTPVILAFRNNRLYVLNQGDNTVAGFRLHED